VPDERTHWFPTIQILEVGQPLICERLIMIKPRKSLKNPRRNAFQLQNGACFYCGCPMWTADATEFAQLHSISPKNLSKFQCTGEHLTPHSEGGSCNQRNIVAAHAFCNHLRHRSKSVCSPDQFRQHVIARIRRAVGTSPCGTIDPVQRTPARPAISLH
jgi:hypothetical protein